ncbi:hypothetical protein PAEH1_02865 [Paenalcaligenes hominis]|uniref:Uncharacterized protein n=1 Tax=Paenalcaligenes hominis TaxID=643674 RepID=A0A1U9JYD6_9BURK|nr:hypothetical protein [Paenalcaligenes hominis]AQS50764.1 hypothetical protein PAEH1_02865 [Paenalcaligenes hominis]
MTTPIQTPPRPKLSEHLILLALETHHANKADEWNFEDIAQEYTDSMDGYDLMRSLEAACYWDGSRELIDELDTVCYSIRRTVDQAIKDWVVAYRVRPSFAPGEEITYEGKQARIKDMDMPMARYAIQFHEPCSKLLPCTIGSDSALYVEYEEVEL